MFVFIRIFRLGHKLVTLNEKLENPQISHKERMKLMAEYKIVEYKLDSIFA